MSNLLKSVIASSQQKRSVLEKLGAVFAIDAKYSKPGEQWVLNRGSGGQVLRARYGSVGRAEIRNGVGLVNVGRVSGTSVVNYAATPYTAAMYSPNELEVVVRVSLDNWATYADTASMGIIGRNSSSAANNSFNVSLIQTTRLLFFGASNGTSYLTTSSTAAVPFADGQMVWLKVTWRKSDGRVQFWWAADQATEPSSWTQLGADRTLMAGVSMNTAGTDDLRFMGCPGASYYGNGVMARAILRTAIGGANALDVDFAAQPDLVSSFVASTGQTVTVTAANAVDTNDPLWLPWNGENYVYFPGTTGNIITTAWSAAAFTTCSWRMKVRLDSLPGSVVAIAGADSTYGTVQIDTIGRIVCGHRDAATNLIGAQWSSVPVPGLIGGDVWLRADLDATTATCTYYVSSDSTNDETAVTWTQVGTPVVGAFAGNTPDPRANILSGSNSVGLAGFPARFYAMSFYTNGVCRTAWRMVGQDPTLTTGTSLTINRATSGRKTEMVTRSVWVQGPDDNMLVADNNLLDFAAGQDFSLVAVYRQFPTVGDYSVIMGTKGGGGNTAGIYMVSDTITSGRRYVELGDGSSSAISGIQNLGAHNGALEVLIAVRSSGILTIYRNGVAGNSVSAAINTTTTNPLAMGCSGISAQFSTITSQAYAVFRRALTTQEIAQIVSAYRTS